jgi:hypothetical protein
MRKFLVAGLVLLAACGPRQVEVRTAPSQTADVSLHFTNNLSQAVNVYVTQSGTDMFVRQVAANSTEHIPVPGVSDGSTVVLKATLVDGSRTYSRTNVVMTSMVNWSVP